MLRHARRSACLHAGYRTSNAWWVIDALVLCSLVLFNESFSATSEREGSEIARQIVHALLATPVKIVFVTHLFQFVHSEWKTGSAEKIFLCAAGRDNGARTFRLQPGEPLPTSYSVDFYEGFLEPGTAFVPPG